MKRVLFAVALVGSAFALPAKADLIHRMTTSTQLTVDAAASQATRIGSTYSTSGNNITASTFGGLTAATGDNALTAPATMTDGTYAMTTAGSAYSFSESFTMGDSVNTAGTTVNSGVVPALPAFGSVTTSSGGVAGDLAGTITTAGAVTLTAGGAGTSATGQFVSEVTVK
tara:strand:- start:587 stop:1096 length:510 start_codon:yes stop_codon:yes gene_type:complete